MTGRRPIGTPRRRLVALAGVFVVLWSCGKDKVTGPPRPTEPPRILAVSVPQWSTVSGTVTILVTTQKADSVALLVDGLLKATDREAPFALSWNTLRWGNGVHLLVTRARNVVGVTDSTVIAIVYNPGQGTGVAVKPLAVVLHGGDSLQFTAIVLDNVDTRVTWSLETPGGDPGSIDSTGFYRAPDMVYQPTSVTVRARSVAETGTVGLATVTLY